MQREDKGQIFPVKQPHICHLHINIFRPVMRFNPRLAVRAWKEQNPEMQPLSLAQWLVRDPQDSSSAAGRDRAESWVREA